MAYQIFLTDGVSSAQMDTEDIETKTIFGLVEIQDIGIKRNNIQSLQFKGTDRNNEAFGYFFDFGRTTDLNNPNKLFFNYNPIREVKVIIYEETEVIFIGDLRLTEIDVDNKNNILYKCIVTTSLSILKNVLSDKFLTDLDFRFMQHRYCWDTIFNSWVSGGTYLEFYNTTTNTFYSNNYDYGVGYTYPIIDYGYRFNATSGTFSGVTVPADQIISLRNFKPAVFVKQYLTSIFEQPVLSGFTYEIRGGDDFVNMFNKLVIPETNLTPQNEIFNTITTQEPSSYPDFYDYNLSQFDLSRFLTTQFILPDVTQPTGNLTNYVLASSGNLGLQAQRTIVTSVKANIDVDITTFDLTWDYTGFGTIVFTIRHIKSTGTDIIATSDPFIVFRDSTYNFQTELYTKDIQINKNDIIAITASFNLPLNGFADPNDDALTLSFNELKLSIAGNPEDGIIYYTEPSNTCSGINVPSAPNNIKQLDFLKSLIQQFNFIVYTENTNYKHFIFEPYDSFYAKCNINNFLSSALNWTNKIDYNNGYTIKSNIELPKSYLFTYKSDIDFLNKTYKDKYNEVYGQFSFNDEYGLTDQKKIELIFSPMPVTTINNIMKPLLYKVENNQVIPTQLNLRLGYYNGYNLYDNLSGQTYVGYEAIGTTGISVLAKLSNYPQLSNYYVTSNASGYTVQNDIHFNQPKEIYFTNTNDQFLTAPTSYFDYYINQVTELTSEDIVFVDCNILLNTIDIANLQLNDPIWIDTGINGGAYFKIIDIEYENKDLPSKVRLQKILL